MERNDNSNIGIDAMPGFDHTLVRKIMELIEQHHEEEGALPDPASLRDSLLAVAALLHIEAGKISGTDSETDLASAGGCQTFHKTFADAAEKRLRAVLDIVIHRHDDLQ